MAGGKKGVGGGGIENGLMREFRRALGEFRRVGMGLRERFSIDRPLPRFMLGDTLQTCSARHNY